jgi:hypothetical protein
LISEKRSGQESILVEETFNSKEIPKRKKPFEGNDSVLTVEDSHDGPMQF